MLKNLAVIGALVFMPLTGFAQSAGVTFDSVKVDPNEPVEITADELSVDQTNGSAVFAGNVVAGHGELRFSAGQIRVQYAVENGQNTGVIDQLIATGGVVLVNGAEAAEAREAVYSVGASQIEMTGDVVLTQGQTALSGEKLIVDLAAGTGRMVGRVKTIFNTGGNN
jgi:lipopolysaccharide export system protein LptA